MKGIFHLFTAAHMLTRWLDFMGFLRKSVGWSRNTIARTTRAGIVDSETRKQAATGSQRTDGKQVGDATLGQCIATGLGVWPRRFRALARWLDRRNGRGRGRTRRRGFARFRNDDSGGRVRPVSARRLRDRERFRHPWVRRLQSEGWPCGLRWWLRGHSPDGYR